MNFSLSFLILFLATTTALTQDTNNTFCKTVVNPSGIDSCSNKEVGEGYRFCCLLEVEFDNETKITQCEQLTITEYRDIDYFIDAYERMHPYYDDVEIECEAKYLATAFMVVLSLILLL